jgi:hypothetical protein
MTTMKRGVSRSLRGTLLAAALGLMPSAWLACATTTEADATTEEQQAYGKCLDACRNEPAEQSDEGPDEATLRICREDCNAEYPRDEWVDDSSARDRDLRAGTTTPPHPPSPQMGQE